MGTLEWSPELSGTQRYPYNDSAVSLANWIARVLSSGGRVKNIFRVSPLRTQTVFIFKEKFSSDNSAVPYGKSQILCLHHAQHDALSTGHCS